MDFPYIRSGICLTAWRRPQLYRVEHPSPTRPMKHETAHCTRIGKPVQLLLARQSREVEPEVICLDFGPECSRGMCPIGKVAPVIMEKRLDRLLSG